MISRATARKEYIYMKKYLLLLAITIISISSSSYADTGFKDVSTSHWALPFINSLKASEIIGGYPDGTFKPQSNVKINEFIAMTVKALGYRFESMSSDWAKPYIDKAIELKIIEDREFDSYSANINREQMTSIVVHAVSLNETMPNGLLEPYIKAETTDYHLVSDYYKQAVLDSYKLGIITGYDDKSFRPKNFSTRAEASAVISKILSTDLRKPFVKADARYVLVPVNGSDEFGSDITYDTALYAPLLNGKPVNEMIDVVELLLKNVDFGKGYVGVGYTPYEKVVGATAFTSKEKLDWFSGLTFYEKMAYVDSVIDFTLAIDFNNFTHQYKPYDLSFDKKPSMLENHSSYSAYFIERYGDQLRPLFQYWFEDDYNIAWNTIVKALDSKGTVKTEYFTFNGRTMMLVYGSDVCTFGFSLKN